MMEAMMMGAGRAAGLKLYCITPSIVGHRGFGKANANTDIVRIAAKVIVIIVFLYTLR